MKICFISDYLEGGGAEIYMSALIKMLKEKGHQVFLIIDKELNKALSSQEINVYKEIKKLYESKMKVICTGCSYCLLCPSGVYIPAVFNLYNSTFSMDDPAVGKERYKSDFSGDWKDASKCTECGECEEKCPQGISISEHLKKAHAWLDTKK